MSTDISFEEFRNEWLADVRADDPSTTQLGHRFARKLLTQWLDIDDSSDDLVYCDGAGDGGIDIAYLHRADTGGDDSGDPGGGDTWYLVQSKYGKAFRGTNTLLEEAQKVIDTLDGHAGRLSSLAVGLLERLRTFRGQASERDRIVLVFGTEEPLNEAQKRALNDIGMMGRGRLGPLFDVEAVSIETIFQRLQAEPGGGLERLRIPLRADLARSGDELLVGAVSLIDLYGFLKAYRYQTGDLDQLYEKNVRRFLGGRGRVNHAMQQTLRDAPERFGLYNNGVTLVVEDFSTANDNQVELVDPYIVNGCQTTRTIWEVLHQKLEAGGTGSNPELEDWRQKIAHGVVVTKIVKVGAQGETLLQAITRYTNSQNTVREKDFLALSTGFQTWAKQMAERYGVFLEVQRGGWDSRKALQRQNPSLKPHFDKSVNAFDLLKVYGAGWLGEAGTAFGKNGPFLPGGTIFRRIMESENIDGPFGVEDLYAAYRLEQVADGYAFGRGSQELSRRQTRFLFYLVAIDLLREVLVRAGDQAPTPKAITVALLALFESGNEEAARALFDSAVDTVDEYLTSGTEDSVHLEPVYQNAFNNDLNRYLKYEKLGKTEEASPHLRALLAVNKRTMGRRAAGGPSPRDLILEALGSGTASARA